MKKILIVEDDDFFRAALEAIFKKKYQVQLAPNGKIAKELISLMFFDMIISDIQMPFVTGVELLEWTKKNHPTKFILMTGFSKILETKEAHNLGADDFILKPFSDVELLDKIQLHIGENQPPATISNIDNNLLFCKIPIEDFVSQKVLEFDVYINLSSSKYIKIAHAGTQIPQDKILGYKEKNVKFLYIRQEDFYKLVGFNLLVAKAISANGAVEKEKKERFLKYTGELIIQQVYVVGIDANAFSNAKAFFDTSLDILTEDQETFKLLNLLSQHSNDLYAHSLGVSLFSVLIAKKLGFQSPSVLFKLAFGGLFHDIGKKEIDPEILNKNRTQLTSGERKILETHTTRGREILETLKTAPSEVILMAYEHHEDVLGQGIPRGLPRAKIHPLSLITQVANTFCEYTLKSANYPAPLSGKDAIHQIDSFKKDSLDEITYQALKDLILDVN